MLFLKPAELKPPSLSKSFQFSPDGSDSFLVRSGADSFRILIHKDRETVCLEPAGLAVNPADLYVKKAAAEYLFSHDQHLKSCYWKIAGKTESVVSRDEHYADPTLFHFNPDRPNKESSDLSDSSTGPFTRPVHPPETVLYRRFWPETGKTVSLELVSPDLHLKLFHEWQNQDRVHEFWELKGSLSDHRQYLDKALKDPHSIPVILSYNDVPAGYFEIYWAWDDRIAPFYQADPYDRGMHLLIGDTRYLGFSLTYTAWCSVTHFMFLEDKRTRGVVLEPRHDNQKIMKYVNAVDAFRVLKEFDFPHKRAKLIHCERDNFFKGNYL